MQLLQHQNHITSNFNIKIIIPTLFTNNNKELNKLQEINNKYVNSKLELNYLTLLMGVLKALTPWCFLLF